MLTSPFLVECSKIIMTEKRRNGNKIVMSYCSLQKRRTSLSMLLCIAHSSIMQLTHDSIYCCQSHHSVSQQHRPVGSASSVYIHGMKTIRFLANAEKTFECMLVKCSRVHKVLINECVLTHQQTDVN